MFRQYITANMLTHEELGRMEVDPQAEEQRRRRAAEATTDPILHRQAKAIFDKWDQNMREALASVREDKRNLYLNPALRWWIEHAQLWAHVHNSDMGKDFFDRLALAVRAGVGRDKRMEKLRGDWRPAEWAEYHVRRLRRQATGWGSIAKELHLAVDEAQLRHWAKRRGIQ